MGMKHAAAVLTCVALAGCASPDPRLYTLAATDAPPLPAAGRVVELRRVTIPGYLDRPEIVRSAADYRVRLASNERWSEPLGDVLQRVLTQDLTHRLSGGTVYSDTGGISAKATAIVEVDLDRLDTDGAGLAVLDAQFSLAAPDDSSRPLTRRVHIEAPVSSPTTSDYAAALSTLAGRLADAIVAELRTLSY